MTVETGVLERYSAGAESIQADLCCPVDYDRELLALLPQEIIDKDYGCGDPSRYVKKGDVVLDLGSGSGKICYMAAQLVGDNGKVIGVDMNDDMLALSRKYQQEMAQKLGSNRVKFVKGQIQDLALDLTAMNTHLAEHPIYKAEDIIALRAWQEKQRKNAPLIADNSVDLVVSNCVLNLVHVAFRSVWSVRAPQSTAARIMPASPPWEMGPIWRNVGLSWLGVARGPAARS
jgi:SAM-dependent methyltransferase